MSAPEQSNEEKRSLLRELMFATPYIEGLGLVAERWESAGVRLRLPFRAELTNDGSAFHGGAIASLMDTAGAAAVWAGHDFAKGARAATVSMTINYTGTAKDDDLLADAVCVKRGRDLAFSEIHVHSTHGSPVATGTLVYRIVP